MVPKYNPQEIEKKWQERWERDRLYEVKESDPRPKRYELTMFPYTSGDLHIGHWYAMAPSDVHARFKRMQGYNVIHPMGFDAFGLPAENAAINRRIHPYIWTMQNIENMRRQLKSIGAIYDWEREVITCLPDYSQIVRRRSEMKLDSQTLRRIQQRVSEKLSVVYPFIRYYWLTAEGLDRAIELCTATNIDAPDCIHLATALEVGCDLLVSNDTLFIAGSSQFIASSTPEHVDDKIRELGFQI